MTTKWRLGGCCGFFSNNKKNNKKKRIEFSKIFFSSSLLFSFAMIVVTKKRVVVFVIRPSVCLSVVFLTPLENREPSSSKSTYDSIFNREREREKKK